MKKLNLYSLLAGTLLLFSCEKEVPPTYSFRTFASYSKSLNETYVSLELTKGEYVSYGNSQHINWEPYNSSEKVYFNNEQILFNNGGFTKTFSDYQDQITFKFGLNGESKADIIKIKSIDFLSNQDTIHLSDGNSIEYIDNAPSLSANLLLSTSGINDQYTTTIGEKNHTVNNFISYDYLKVESYLNETVQLILTAETDNNGYYETYKQFYIAP